MEAANANLQDKYMSAFNTEAAVTPAVQAKAFVQLVWRFTSMTPSANSMNERSTKITRSVLKAEGKNSPPELSMPGLKTA